MPILCTLIERFDKFQKKLYLYRNRKTMQIKNMLTTILSVFPNIHGRKKTQYIKIPIRRKNVAISQEIKLSQQQ